jgi:hypothetical protein
MSGMAGFMRIARVLMAGSMLALGVSAGAQGLQDAHRDHTPPLDDARVPKPEIKPAAAKSGATVKTGIVARGVSRPKEPKPAAQRPFAKGKSPAAATVPPSPVAEPTPEQPVILRPQYMPAVAPRISYEGGQLMIVASNSTLADIFAGIRSVTGVKIETTGGGSNERVAAKIGPAPLRSVLLSLLQGARYDYVILGNAQDPEKVDRVILTPKLAGGAQATAAVSQPLRQPEPNMETMESADPVEPGSPADDENEGFAPVNQPAQPQPGAEQPQGQPQPQQDPSNPTTPNPNAPPKTPEQLLEDLKRLEQERQQQNQQRDPRGERPR